MLVGKSLCFYRGSVFGGCSGCFNLICVAVARWRITIRTICVLPIDTTVSFLTIPSPLLRNAKIATTAKRVAQAEANGEVKAMEPPPSTWRKMSTGGVCVSSVSHAYGGFLTNHISIYLTWAYTCLCCMGVVDVCMCK